jgi:catechol 2,3-dioxygenase-like lactoylglutathione lyase family enzyme
MGLGPYKVNASIAISDMPRAQEFYEGRLGLSAERAQADGSRIYASGGGASLHVYPSPAHAGKSTATLATWYVDDVERVVDELNSQGVAFEHYDEVTTDAKGISPRTGGGKVAWFKDPDGNTFAVEEESKP